MSLVVMVAGIQTTLQGAPREGLRHFGVPQCGPADQLSMALANRLVQQPDSATVIEITLGPVSFQFEAGISFAVTGAEVTMRLGSKRVETHTTLAAAPGDRLEISAARAGARTYLAIAGSFEASRLFGSTSTYLPAAFGGHQGRALKAGDRIAWTEGRMVAASLSTPVHLRPHLSQAYALRVVTGPDWPADRAVHFSSAFNVTNRVNRMGVEIVGAFPALKGTFGQPSAALFPGAIQLTPSGRGFILGCDGQTTGGYPHILQVIRADRHLIGQVRPKDRITLVPLQIGAAVEALRVKQALFADWLAGFRF